MKKILTISLLAASLFMSYALRAQVYHSCNCACDWGYFNTGANAAILLEPALSFQVIKDGVPIQSNSTHTVRIGGFYDSLGTLTCAGYVEWGGTGTAITLWGAETGQINGFATNEAFKWKVCITDLNTNQSNFYNATANYITNGFTNTSTYITNGMSALSELVFNTSLGVEATSILSPSSGCMLSNAEPVTVTFTNNEPGDITENMWLSYSINGGSPVTETYTGDLLSGQSVTYTFSQTADLSALGIGGTDSIYTISFSAQLSLSNDANQSDNTISSQVINMPGIEVSFSNSYNASSPAGHTKICYYPAMPPVTLTGIPAGGTFSGLAVYGNHFFPDIARNIFPTQTEFQICYSFSDPVSGCTSAFCDTFYLFTPPVASITNTDLHLCVFDSLTLTGTPPGGIFQGSSILNSGTGLFYPTIAGTYGSSYTYLDPVTGCSDTSAVKNFVVHALPIANFVDLKRAYCSDEADVVLQGSPTGGVFTGSTGASVVNGIFSPSQSSVQTMTLKYAYTDANGCYDDVMMGVKVFDGNPELNFNGLDTAYCEGDAGSMLTAIYSSGAPILSWAGASNGFFTPNPAGVHTVTLTGIWANAYYYDTAYCDRTVSHSTTVYELPEFIIQPQSQEVNVGDTLYVTSESNGSGVQYQWQKEENNSFVNLTNYGPYSGVQSSVLGIQGASINLNQTKYRCVASTPYCADFSQEIILTVNPWSYLNTGSNHSILVQSTVPITINGIPIDTGDYIGVFYDSAGILVNCGFMEYTGVNDAFSAWGADTGLDGLANGEAFKWKILDVSEGIIHQAYATYLSGFPNQGFFVHNGMSALGSLITVESQIIALPELWSIFSTYINPINPTISVLLNPMISSVSICKDGAGAIFWPQYNVNNIGNLQTGKGYQIKMSQAEELTVTGQRIAPETAIIELPALWSILGYLRTEPADISQILGPYSSNISLVKSGAGMIYWPQYSVNSIGNMQPGVGYQLKALAAFTLTYPANN